MKDYIEERAINIAMYIIDNNTTVRQTAKAFGVSKSTVHKDVTSRLMQVNPTLAKQARAVLDVNKSERHIRGLSRDSPFYYILFPLDTSLISDYTVISTKSDLK